MVNLLNMKYLPSFEKVLIQVATLVCVLFLCMIVSCNDDDENPSNSDLLIGKWSISATTLDMNLNGKSLVQYLVQDVGLSQPEAEMFEALFEEMLQESFVGTIEFKADKTTIYNIGGDSDTGTWRLSNDGKTLYLDEGTIDETTVNIIELTSSKLSIEMTQTEEADLDEDGSSENVTVEVSMTLSRMN